MNPHSRRHEFDIDSSTRCDASWWEDSFELTIGLQWDEDEDDDWVETEADEAPTADGRNDRGVWLSVGGAAACMMSGPIDEDEDLDVAGVSTLPDPVDLAGRAARIIVRWPQPVRTCRYVTAAGMRLRVAFGDEVAASAWSVDGSAVLAVSAAGELAALDVAVVDQDAPAAEAAESGWIHELKELPESGVPGPASEQADESQHSQEAPGTRPLSPAVGMRDSQVEQTTLVMLRTMVEQLEALRERGVSTPVLVVVEDEFAAAEGWVRMVSPMSGQAPGAPELAVTWAGATGSVTVAVHVERPTVPFHADAQVDVMIDDEAVAFHHQLLELPPSAASAPTPRMHQLLGQVDGAWITIDTVDFDPALRPLPLVRLSDPAAFAADLKTQVEQMRIELAALESHLDAPTDLERADARDAIQDWIRGVMSADAVLVAARTDPQVVAARGGAHRYIEQVAACTQRVEFAGVSGAPVLDFDAQRGTARMQYAVRIRTRDATGRLPSVAPAAAAPHEHAEAVDQSAWITARRAADGLWYVDIDLLDVVARATDLPG